MRFPQCIWMTGSYFAGSQPTDRVPVARLICWICAQWSSEISFLAFARCLNHLGLPPRPSSDDCFQDAENPAFSHGAIRQGICHGVLEEILVLANQDQWVKQSLGPHSVLSPSQWTKLFNVAVVSRCDIGPRMPLCLCHPQQLCVGTCCSSEMCQP